MIILAIFLLTSTVNFGFIVGEAKIAKGNTTANIKAVQSRLVELKFYSGKVDGIWGSGTTNAVKKFQRSNGLSADGIVGERTEKALGVKLSGSSGGASSSGGKDMELLARCIHAEARGEPYEGQVAVGAVILNRVKSSKFPNSISGVIYQPLAFTCVADGQINLTAGESAKRAAKDCMNGWDPSNGCLYYYNPSTATSKWIWSLKVELKIGRHSFARG